MSIDLDSAFIRDLPRGGDPDCSHDQGFRIAHGRVWCGACSYNSWLPKTWVKGRERIDCGTVRLATGGSVMGMLINNNGPSIPVITSNFVSATKAMILAEERLSMMKATWTTSGVINLDLSSVESDVVVCPHHH